MELNFYLRSAGFEPAIPSLGSSYLDQSGLTSLNRQLHSTNNKFVSLIKHGSNADISINAIYVIEFQLVF